MSFHRAEDGLTLVIADDGVGLTASPREGSTGQRLVKALARQLGGHATWISPPGTRVIVSFPQRRSDQQVY